jgi:hypothetical protein
MTTVFIVEHTCDQGTDDGDVKRVGTFSTRAKALAAITHARAQAGFRDYPDAFAITEVPVDETWWPRKLLSVIQNAPRG